MYNVSNEYRKAINKLSRETKISGVMTLLDGTEILIETKDIMLGTLNIDNACVSGQDFELGSVYMGQLKMSINTHIDRYKMYGATITLSYFLKLENGNFEEVPLGVYTVDDATRNGKYVSITAYDNMSAFEKDFVTTTNGSAYDLLSFACDNCGITLGQTENDIIELSPKYEDGSEVIFKINDENAFSTFRDLVSEVAMTLGGFATIDRRGNLVVRRFSTTPIEIDEKHRKKTNISDYKVSYSSVQLTIDDEVYTSGTDNEKTLVLTSNLWNTGTSDVKQSIADNILDAISGTGYTPADIDFDGDPALDLGDSVKYIGGSVDEAIYSYVMTSNWTYRSTHKITAVGSNPLLANAKTRLDKQLNKTNDAVKQNELKISTFQSATVFEINDENQLIVQMGINATSGVMVFQGQCIIDVQTPGTFEIVYELNGDIMQFQPKQIATQPGFYMINLYYPITTLSTDYTNNFNVYLNSSDGGTGIIDNGSIVANLIGSNLGATKNTFNGVVDLSSKFTMKKISGFEKVKFTGRVDVEIMKPTTSVFREEYKKVNFGGVGLYNSYDNVDIE